MKKLASITRLFKDEELLNKNEAAAVNGGRRYVTPNYGNALAVISMLQSAGIATEMNKHGGNYCVEW
ncbi:MAG: hypothetical protein AB8G22_03990 [Saprospiraceae bacterium]